MRTRICFKLMMQSGDFKNEERIYSICLAPMNGLGRFLWQFKGKEIKRQLIHMGFLVCVNLV